MKRTPKSVVSLLLCMVMALSLLCSCAREPDNTQPDAPRNDAPAGQEVETPKDGPAPEEDVITVMVPPLSNNYFAEMKKWADQFHEEYPHLTLKVIETSWDDHDQKLSTMASAGEAPDIAEVAYYNVGKYVQNGTAIDMSRYMSAEQMADYDANVLAFLQMDGGTYGAPLYTGIQTIGANRDMLEAAGVDVDKVQTGGWTFDEFLEALKNGTTDSCYGFVFSASGVTSADYVNVFGKAAGLNSAFNEDLKYDFTSRKMLNLLQATEDMVAAGYMPDYGIEALARWTMCITGEAMIVGKAPSSFENLARKNNAALDANDGTATENSIRITYARLPMPMMEGVPESCFASVDGLAMFRNVETTEEHLKNVATALYWLSSGDRAGFLCGDCFETPVCGSGREAFSKYAQEGMDERNAACGEYLVSKVIAPPAGVSAEQQETASRLLDEVIVPKVQALLAGEVGAQDAYQMIVDAAVEAFGEENCNLN